MADVPVSTWAEIEQALTPELTREQIALRDGTAKPSPVEGQARRRRIENLEASIQACVDNIADLDRYASHASGAQLLGAVVGPYMASHVAQRRKETVTHAENLREELDYLRGR